MSDSLRVQLFVTPRTVAYQAPQSMGFSRKECWSRLPLPSPGDLPNPGIKPRFPSLQADASPFEPHCFTIDILCQFQTLKENGADLEVSNRIFMQLS